MSTRRDATAALLIGTPLISGAASADATDIIAPKKAPENPISEEAARIISYTLYAEARGESYEGQKAVAAVIATRARILKKSPAEVCIQDRQFSCWNEISAVPYNYYMGVKIQPGDLKSRTVCYSLAWLLLARTVNWDHFTHFYNPSKATPSWKNDLQGVKMIGNHVFGYMDSKELPR